MDATIMQMAIKLAKERYGKFWHRCSFDEQLTVLNEAETAHPKVDPRDVVKPPFKTASGTEGISGGTRQ